MNLPTNNRANASLQKRVVAEVAPSKQEPKRAADVPSVPVAIGLQCQNKACRSTRTVVRQTRKAENAIFRERECLTCKLRWWTRETIA